MMKSNQYFDKIQDFLHGRLSDDEREAFEKKIQADPELQEAVEVHMLADDAMELLLEDSLREELIEMAGKGKAAPADGGAPPETHRAAPRRMLIRWAAAAGILLLLGFFGLQWQVGNYSDQALGSRYYAQPDITNVRASNQNGHPLKEGFQLMQAEDYAAAITFFERIQEQSLMAEAQYFLGHAYYENGNYEAAANAFEQVVERKDIRYQQKAEWNLLLAYLAAGQEDTEKFRTLLNSILANPDHTAYSSAEKLQKRLNSFWRKIAD